LMNKRKIYLYSIFYPKEVTFEQTKLKKNVYSIFISLLI